MPEQGLLFLFLGYSVIWVALFAYITMLFGRQRHLEREVKTLQEALGQGGRLQR